MATHDTQSFFTPDEFSCQKSSLLSNRYNLAQTLLHRSKASHLFIPIRSLQYLAIIEKNTFWFVDSMVYAVRGDEGGRLIRISWHLNDDHDQRDDLTQPMDCRIIFYGGNMQDIQTRLNSEFYKSMLQIDQRHRDSLAANYKVNILPLKIEAK